MPKAIYFSLPEDDIWVARLISPPELTPNHKFIGIMPGDPVYKVYCAPDGVYDFCECDAPPTAETAMGILPTNYELPFM